ncbi:MAG: hypothetical protein IT174_10690 [Acidobacteria bacterium]|nr:hypothetical protein [Acidobacteriota bacterium]
MPKKIHPECISDCFDLYLKYNGSNFPAIQKEMREKGWSTFTSQNIRKKVKGEYEGWEIDFGWKKALDERNARKGQVAMTSAEGLHYEVESVRKNLYEVILEKGIRDPDNKWLLWEHGKYVKKTAEILSSMDAARDNYANFVFFLKHLLSAATKISPEMARALCEAEDALLDWAEKKFVVEDVHHRDTETQR